MAVPPDEKSSSAIGSRGFVADGGIGPAMGVPFAALRDPGHVSTPVLPLASVAAGAKLAPSVLRRRRLRFDMDARAGRRRPTPASELRWLRRGPPGTSTSLGTTSTGHPARLGRRGARDRILDGQALPPARDRATPPHADTGRVPACRCAPRRRIPTPRSIGANAVQRTLGERPLRVGDQRHRSPFGGKRFQHLARTGAPRQAAVEQLGGVVVQPAVGLAPSPPDRAPDRDRCRRCAWCPRPSRRPSTPAPAGSARRRAARTARPARRPRAFRSRRGCRPCPTAPHACPICHDAAARSKSVSGPRQDRRP